MKDLFIRSQRNPVITTDQIPYPCHSVFNPGACRFHDQYLLLLRVEDLEGVSHFTLARSKNGEDFTVDPRPWVLPSKDPAYEPYERFGIEDPRITRIGETYYITFTAYGPFGPRGGLACTRDFVEFRRLGFPTETDNKDLVLFPEKMGDRFVLLDRPGGFMAPYGSIWVTYSPDLVHWGRAEVVLSPRPGWAPYKLGAGPPPIKTKKGWLLLYHGVRTTESGKLYRVGVALLDLDNPAQVIGMSQGHVFEPKTPYERHGDVPNVVFPTGLVAENDDTLLIYYGAADTCIGLARVSLSDLIETCQ
jgi:beta-1,4-mannooligosaccharide/beta-1,4-mannosyl-N-acetylglucosamine phosphorylase